MSISLALVPLAIAAIGAWQVSRQETDDQGRIIQHVQTRMRDERLLEAALVDTRASVVQTANGLTAEWREARADFHRDAQGIWQVDFTGDVTQEHAMDIVVAIDQAYGRQVQRAVLARLRERAPAAGMTVSSETVDVDGGVTLVLDVARGA